MTCVSYGSQLALEEVQQAEMLCRYEHQPVTKLTS